jgi:hypothetical protein
MTSQPCVAYLPTDIKATVALCCPAETSRYDQLKRVDSKAMRCMSGLENLQLDTRCLVTVTQLPFGDMH